MAKSSRSYYFTLLFALMVLLQVQTLAFQPALLPAGATTSSTTRTVSTTTNSRLFQSSSSPEVAAVGQPTELPDSLEDAAQMAAQACHQMIEAAPGGRCRVDFDTSAGDETFTLLKQSTEFMQNLVTSLCYLQMPDLQLQKQQEMMNVVNAQNELKVLQEELENMEENNNNNNDDESDQDENNNKMEQLETKMEQLQEIIQRGGRDPDYKYEGPKARIYFPDEGNAALARRDWTSPKNGGGTTPLVPPCVEFSSCGGVQSQDTSQDRIIFFFCPKASESAYVEQILDATEAKSNGNLQLSVLVNPILVDMGVTGFGMAGRLLRERLIDPLQYAYYLRTLPWGALTRVWPREFSVWQEDEDAEAGYRLIRTLPTLPSNPEVEDIYDIENGLKDEKKGGGGFLDQLGDFVNGMTKL